MRKSTLFCGLIAMIFSGKALGEAKPGAGQGTPPASLVDRPLSGFRYVIINPPIYSDGRIDYMSLKPYTEHQLAQQGWIILSQSDMATVQKDRMMASATVRCGIAHTANNSFRADSVTLTCFDVLGRVPSPVSPRARRPKMPCAANFLRARPRIVNRNSISGETAELQRRFPARTPFILSIRLNYKLKS